MQARACAQWVQSRAQAIKRAFKAASDLLVLETQNAEDLTQGGVLQQAIDYVLNDPTAWVQFTLGLAGEGTLLTSSLDPVAWYAVTHKAPCAGARVTTNAAARARAHSLGVALAAPRFRELNPGLAPQTLLELDRALRAQKMFGLTPVLASIIEGFEEGVRIWDGAQAESRGETPSLASIVAMRRVGRKFRGSPTGGARTKADIDFGEDQTSSYPVIGVAGGALAGYFIGNIPGAVLGALGGLLIGTALSSDADATPVKTKPDVTPPPFNLLGR